MFYGTWMSLLPPLVAIILALTTKQVYFSLFTGVVLGAFLAADLHPWGAFDTLYRVMIENFDTSIIIFLIVLSMVIVLMQRSGSTKAYGEWAAGKLKSKRAALLATSFLGILIFVDDGFNCLTVGSVMRPLTDKYKVSRAKLAYIIDATAAPVCILAPVSSWAAAINSYVPDGYPISGFQLFLATIPFNLYAILTIYMVFFTSASGIDFGLMKEHEEHAAKGDLFTSGGEQFIEEGERERKLNQGNGRAGVRDLVLPMAVMIICSVGAMIWTGYLNGGRSVAGCFANCESAKSLVFATLITLIFTAVLYIPRKIFSVREFMDIIPEGAKLMIPFMIILVLAWTLKGLINELGAGAFIATLMDVNSGAVQLLPVLFFAIAVFISFSSGTSWGTFAIMVPLVIGMFGTSNRTMMTICVAAVLSGAVCGDHISPISDTTIMSSSGAQCNHLNHVQTQIQYAVPVVLVSLAGYLIAGFTGSWWISLLFSVIMLTAVLLIIGRKEKKKDEKAKRL